MIPCSYCQSAAGARGLKRVGKTRYTGPLFARRYRCQDCNAAMIWSGDLRDETSSDERWFPPGTFNVPARERGRVRLAPTTQTDGEQAFVALPTSTEEAA